MFTPVWQEHLRVVLTEHSTPDAQAEARFSSISETCWLSC